jgi:glutathione synthase/RimK-type ligase-like ATP-grasp enzyme
VPTILLLTAERLSHEDHETTSVAAALAAVGVESLLLPWTDPSVLRTGADLALIRSTWDYTARLPDFLSVLAELPMPVVNRVEVVRWNCHKSYLTTLAAAGVPVVPTALVRAAAVQSGAAPELPEFGSAEVIVKPATSAGARGVGRFPSSSTAALDHLESLLTVGDVLVQPFLPDVADGERSLVFLGGRYSHAVRKTPAAGDFRVQEQYGGVIVPHLASAAELTAAGAALDVVPGGAQALLYARVDVIGPPTAPLIMELELIEPELFLPHAPGSAAALAQAAVALL